jgi:hypothetical protein
MLEISFIKESPLESLPGFGKPVPGRQGTG